MLSLASSALSFHAPMPAMKSSPVAVRMETQADLAKLADAQHVPMGFWDPIGLAKQDFWGQGNAATIGFLRHAEIKHGRVAMAGFVGYCLQANGVHFPWALSGGPLGDGSGVTYGELSQLTPPEQWDAVPTSGKLQILLTIGVLEYIGETPQKGKGAEKHYMRGGKPGYYPPLTSATGVPHPVPYNLWDPFGFTSKRTAAQNARSLNAEINNGRLAMLGIFSFLCASKGLIVPGLNDLIPAYDGEYMGPFSEGDQGLYFVDRMLNFKIDAETVAAFSN